MGIESIAGPRVGADELRTFVVELLSAAGADAASSAGTAGAVIDTSARAFETHGIRLVPFYLQTLECGRINAAPNVTVERKAAVVHIDADNGFGHATSFAAIDQACAVATNAGVADGWPLIPPWCHRVLHPAPPLSRDSRRSA